MRVQKLTKTCESQVVTQENSCYGGKSHLHKSTPSCCPNRQTGQGGILMSMEGHSALLVYFIHVLDEKKKNHFNSTHFGQKTVLFPPMQHL